MANSWSVGELLSVSSAYWKGCTLQAGVRLEIFSHLENASKRADDLAKLINTNPHATELLLNALSGIDLLKKDKDTYSNTEFSETHLVKSSPKYMGNIILHHHHLVDGWAQLDQAIASGKPVSMRSYGDDIERESFIMGMFNLAMGLAPQIAALVDLSGKKKLLDLGGGPGTYAIHFCLANPELTATIFDRPTTKPFAEKTIHKFNLDKRIDFNGGDFNIDPISGGPYDAAWLSHILHSNSIEACQKIINKTVAQLSSGGMLLIHEFILEDSMDKPEFPALFSLNMLINNGVGRSYGRAELEQMMTNAGLTQIKQLRFESPNDSSIILGVV